MKKVLVFVFPILAILMISGYMVLKTIAYHSCGCGNFNIDNIELRTGIDIPAVTEVSCFEYGLEDIKIADFTLNTEKVNLDYYIKGNDLEFMSSITESNYPLLFEKFINDKNKDNRNYFGASLKLEKHNWEAILDKESGKLWVAIKFN